MYMMFSMVQIMERVNTKLDNRAQVPAVPIDRPVERIQVTPEYNFRPVPLLSEDISKPETIEYTEEVLHDFGNGMSLYKVSKPQPVNTGNQIEFTDRTTGLRYVVIGDEK
jgi:hypothetical protein